MHLIITILPVVTKGLPISPRFTPYNFLSRCKFGNLTTRQPMVGFYFLTFPRFPLRKKEHKSYVGKNRTHDFRATRCAGYLLDHSGDEDLKQVNGRVPPYRGGFFSISSAKVASLSEDFDFYYCFFLAMEDLVVIVLVPWINGERSPKILHNPN